MTTKKKITQENNKILVPTILLHYLLKTFSHPLSRTATCIWQKFFIYKKTEEKKGEKERTN